MSLQLIQFFKKRKERNSDCIKKGKAQMNNYKKDLFHLPKTMRHELASKGEQKFTMQKWEGEHMQAFQREEFQGNDEEEKVHDLNSSCVRAEASGALNDLKGHKK